MLKIEFTASGVADIPAVADTMARIAAALSHVQGVSVSDTPTYAVGVHGSVGVVKRSPGRPRKSADPVDAYVAAGGVMPSPDLAKTPDICGKDEAAGYMYVARTQAAQDADPDAVARDLAQIPPPPAPVAVAEIEAPATLESEIVQAEATLTPDPTSAATPATLDELRAQIRTIAQDRGALWLRPLLEADKVTKVSGLTEATTRAALEAAQ